MLRNLCIFSILCVISLNSACGNKGEPRINAYKQDGLLGLSNTNPNLATSPSYHTYSKDTKLMNKAIEGITGVQSSFIFISGPDAYIRLKVNRGYSKEELRQIAKDAMNALSYMVPRYVFHVTVVPNLANG